MGEKFTYFERKLREKYPEYYEKKYNFIEKRYEDSPSYWQMKPDKIEGEKGKSEDNILKDIMLEKNLQKKSQCDFESIFDDEKKSK